MCNYIILNGEFGSHNRKDSISYEFVNLSYDIEKELLDNKENIEFDEYKNELLNGIYRNIH